MKLYKLEDLETYFVKNTIGQRIDSQQLQKGIGSIQSYVLQRTEFMSFIVNNQSKPSHLGSLDSKNLTLE